MAYFHHISSLQWDLLKEIGNIGTGNATTALSKLLNKKVGMEIPSVKIVSFNEMTELVGGADNIVVAVFLRIEGEAPGNIFFILSIEQAKFLMREMLGEFIISDKLAIRDELSLSALQELGNILSGSYISALSDFTNLSLYPTVPGISIDMAGAIISSGLLELSRVSDYAIVIDTAIIDLQNSEKMNGHFFLLPDYRSFSAIFASLGVAGHD
ncbi:chemotaxis protein CheC [Bacillaceae bacterium Marseille-Q3522]|nr:chemotaxis protein CheC [Bacillaceae bacterium Marseille-Q3522]